jgi:hypothetical protein
MPFIHVGVFVEEKRGLQTYIWGNWLMTILLHVACHVHNTRNSQKIVVDLENEV